MNFYRTLISTFLALLVVPSLAWAQKDASMSKEVTTKTYTLDQGVKRHTHTVKIETMRDMTVALSEKDKGKVNQDRVRSPLEVIKRVWIDNDEDAAFDEALKFSYRKPTGTDFYSDFVLVSDADELFLAIDEGESLKILESARFMKDDYVNTDNTLVYTDENGNEINFRIEKFERMKDKESR